MDRNFKVFIIFFFLQRFNAKLTSDGTFFVKNGKIDTQHWSAEDSRGFIVADNEFHRCSRRIECDELRKTIIEPHSDVKWKKTQEINPKFGDCNSYFNWGIQKSGVYQIWPNNNAYRKLSVFCTMDRPTGGWITVQRRVNKCVDFNQDWHAYKGGFGHLNGNYWIGLDKLHVLAGPGKEAKLLVEIHEADSFTFALYKKFEINDENDGFRLRIGGYEGNASDAMAMQNEMKFSTPDRDNDRNVTSCAVQFSGGWWFNDCNPRPRANLNGLYRGARGTLAQEIAWRYNMEKKTNIVYTEMKIQHNNPLQ